MKTMNKKKKTRVPRILNMAIDDYLFREKNLRYGNESWHPLIQSSERSRRQIGRIGKWVNAEDSNRTPLEWWMSPAEYSECCMSIKYPKLKTSVADRSEMLIKHARSMKHVARLYGVYQNELREKVIAQKVLNVLKG